MENMRKLEVVDPTGYLDGRTKRNLGDIYWEDLGSAQKFIDLGWAKCVDSGECGERVEGPNKLKVHNAVQKVVSVKK